MATNAEIAELLESVSTVYSAGVPDFQDGALMASWGYNLRRYDLEILSSAFATLVRRAMDKWRETEDVPWFPSQIEVMAVCQQLVRELSVTKPRVSRCDGTGWVESASGEGMEPCPTCNPHERDRWLRDPVAWGETYVGPIERERESEESMPLPCRPVEGASIAFVDPGNRDAALPIPEQIRRARAMSRAYARYQFTKRADMTADERGDLMSAYFLEALEREPLPEEGDADSFADELRRASWLRRSSAPDTHTTNEGEQPP